MSAIATPTGTLPASECRTETACDHCGLPVPPGLLEPSAQEQFCCEGCRTVFGIINGCGLDRYYAMREELETEKSKALTTDRGYAEFDDAEWLACHAEALPQGAMRTVLQLQGVHCAACVWLVERLDRVAPGVVESRLDLRRARVTLVWNAAEVTLSRLARALDQLGYPCSVPRESGAIDQHRAEDRRWLVKIGVAGALAGNTMLLAIALYAGLFEGIAESHERMLRFWSTALGLTSLIWPGRVFFVGAIAAIRTRTPHLDLPIGLALFIGGLWGAINTVRGVGEIYFDSITVLVFVLLVGRFIQHTRQRRAVDALTLLDALTPSTARRLDSIEGEATEMPADGLVRGDLVEVRAGDTVPADGVVVAGTSRIDAALVTGESAPVPATSGTVVAAGMTNIHARLVIRVEASGSETRIARLMRLVEDAASRRGPLVRMADRLAGAFVVVVTLLAAITVAIWWSEGATVAIEHATALLIVTCPCALGLATPLVMTVTLGRLAREGVLVKGADAIERLAKPGLMLLDKTGTITEPALALGERFFTATDGHEAWDLAAAVEQNLSHPIANAVRTAVGSPRFAAADAEQIPGLGARGTVDGQRVLVGSVGLMNAESCEQPEDLRAWVEQRLDAGRGVLLVAVDGIVRTAAEIVGDEPREGSVGAIARLNQIGWETRILSGDRTERVERVANAVGIQNALGEHTPESKLAEVERLVSKAGASAVVMVGDGVNDAAALARADVGIAVHGGAEASLEAADIYAGDPGLAPLVRVIDTSRGAVRRIRICMGASLAYNTFAAGLAMGGLIHPITAAIIMPMSSLTVVAIAVWGGRKERV